MEKLFYKISNTDRDRNIAEKHLDKPQVVDVVEYDGVQLKTPNNLPYFQFPRRSDYPLDLNGGIENYVFRNEFQHKLNKVCRYLMNDTNKDEQHEVKESLGDVPEGQRDVITHRMVLIALMMTPYNAGNENKFDWKISATKYKNNLYLIQMSNRNSGKPINNKKSTHHFKLKQYCFSDSPNGNPDTETPINEGHAIFCIYRSRQDNLNLLYSGEMDGLISENEIELNNLEELNKCRFVQTRLVNSSNGKWWKQFNMLRWWIKSYLSGIEDIYMGRKCTDSLIHKPLVHVDVNRLAQNQRWAPAPCLNFMHTFINNVYDEMSDINCPHTVYEFHFESQKSEINFNIYEGPNEHSFLSDEYVDFITKS